MKFGLDSFNLINEFKRAFTKPSSETNHEPFGLVTPLIIASMIAIGLRFFFFFFDKFFLKGLPKRSPILVLFSPEHV